MSFLQRKRFEKKFQDFFSLVVRLQSYLGYEIDSVTFWIKNACEYSILLKNDADIYISVSSVVEF